MMVTTLLMWCHHQHLHVYKFFSLCNTCDAWPFVLAKHMPIANVVGRRTCCGQLFCYIYCYYFPPLFTSWFLLLCYMSRFPTPTRLSWPRWTVTLLWQNLFIFRGNMQSFIVTNGPTPIQMLFQNHWCNAWKEITVARTPLTVSKPKKKIRNSWTTTNQCVEYCQSSLFIPDVYPFLPMIT